MKMNIVKHKSNRFKYAFVYKYNLETLTFCRALKTKYGYGKFGFEQGAWRFNDLDFVYIILDRYPNTEIAPEVKEGLKTHNLTKIKTKEKVVKANELKNKLETDFKVDNINGPGPLRPYQKVAVEFLINNEGKAIIADTMGLGKTLESLAYVAHTGLEKTLIMCPASVKYVWEEEIKKWTNLSSHVIEGKTEVTIDLLDEHNITIINYDILKKFADTLNMFPWDCVIMDEFHYIKNIKAQRTKIAKVIASRVKSILLLSGTPLLSRPVELFNGLQLMDPLKWGDWYRFTRQYCNGHNSHFGYDSSGSSNISELQEKISRYFLRRTKDEVLKELPPKKTMNVPVKMTDADYKRYNLAETNLRKYLEDIKKKDENDVAKSLAAEKLVKLNELRQLSSAGKVATAKDIITNTIDGGEKIVVFSAYNNPLEQLKEYFGDEAILFTGKIDSLERKSLIDDFQSNPKLKVFLGGIKSAGVGITLTAASNVLFLDYSWVPADHAQAIDRTHRIGQTADCITIYQLYAMDTIDQYMKELLEKKQIIFDRLIEGKDIEAGELDKNLFTDVLKIFSKKKVYAKKSNKKNKT